MMVEVVDLGQTCLLGESPLWDFEKQRLLWIDISEKKLHQYYPDTGKHQQVTLTETPGSIALAENGLLITAFKDGFTIFDPNTVESQRLALCEVNKPDNRFNDGKCDPAGRFWAGTMSTKGEAGKGTLYSLDGNLNVAAKIENVSVSNGLAWAPDHQTFYYIDSAEKTVVAYKYDVHTGNISNKKTIIIIDETLGKPDGMTIDSDGKLWIALWNGGKIVRYDPATGNLIEQIELPVTKVTSCTFGGSDLSDLYITTAKAGLSGAELAEQPLAGSLFVLKNTGYKGLKTFKFRTSDIIK